jgi:hypothetical protein
LQQAAYEGILNLLQKLWECAEEKLITGDTKNAFLLTTHNKGKPAWQGTAYRGKIDVLHKVR